MKNFKVITLIEKSVKISNDVIVMHYHLNNVSMHESTRNENIENTMHSMQIIELFRGH